jgi:hypothetical protein
MKKALLSSIIVKKGLLLFPICIVLFSITYPVSAFNWTRPYTMGYVHPPDTYEIYVTQEMGDAMCNYYWLGSRATDDISIGIPSWSTCPNVTGVTGYQYLLVHDDPLLWNYSSYWNSPYDKFIGVVLRCYMFTPSNVTTGGVMFGHYLLGPDTGCSYIPPEDLNMPITQFISDVRTGYAPLVVQFNDTSTGGPTSWSWDFGDGGTSLERNATHTYASAGIYDVSLTVANFMGSNTTMKEGYIEVRPEITPEVYTYSITNTFSEYAGKANCDNMIMALQSFGWGEPLFEKKMNAVTKADFGINPAQSQKTLNDATIHYHVGHGIVPYLEDGENRSGLGLYDIPDNFLSPSEVEGKWGNKNKWVILHSCYALQDERWGRALSTSHGILGFKTMVNVNPGFTERFFHYAIDEKKTIYAAYRLTTYDLYKEDPVPKNVIDGKPDYSGDTEIPVAAVMFNYQTQADTDHLPGIGTGMAPDVTLGDHPVSDEWRCNEVPR